jgi:prophage regulatory protein
MPNKFEPAGKQMTSPTVPTACQQCPHYRPLRLMREPEMLERTGAKRATARDHMNRNSKRYDPGWPQPVPLCENSRAVGFVESEVEAHIARQIARRDAALAAHQTGRLK